MKRLMIALTTMACCCFLNGIFAQGDATLPYKADYSASFKMGNPDYAKKVLEMWKDYDDNQFTRHDYFSDTVVVHLSDGSVTKGKAKNIEGVSKWRGAMASAKSTIHAWVPLYSEDTKDNLVCIWGTEVDTYADGKKETKGLHEVWWFNKDGKVTMIRQWETKQLPQ